MTVPVRLNDSCFVFSFFCSFISIHPYLLKKTVQHFKHFTYSDQQLSAHDREFLIGKEMVWSRKMNKSQQQLLIKSYRIG